MQAALKGIRIVEFTSGAVAPVAGEILAVMGAEVIKIESTKWVDWLRQFPAPSTMMEPPLNASEPFNLSNINKLGIRLNLRTAKGVEIAKRIVKLCDIILENLRPGVIDKLGLGYETTRQIRPDIIMLSASASGAKGPEAHIKGYAPLFAALGGLSDITGYKDGPPVEVRSTMDYTASFTIVVAVMSALIHRQRTGEGQFIDLAAREAVVSLGSDAIMDYTMNGRVASRDGNKDHFMAPHNCYRCKGNDKWISICVANDEEWQAFCKAIGNPEWTKDERFSDQLSRWKNQEELDSLVKQWTLNYTYYEAMEILQKAGVAAVPSFSADDIFGNPHLAERQFTEILVHSEVGAHVTILPPWRLSATPQQVVRDAPCLGEHNQYVYGELLGMSDKEIQELTEEEVIY